ncbi:MAG: bifunctional riboflavin kinase/FAD synthetase [Gammaproteobacteria bacterium]|nr:bifunctional riboflavin kinase/FAD synthetase [Gammaproteobacteria bacterium]
MDFIRGRVNIDRRHRGCVATIGNFDGVHLGHRAVIAQLRQRSRELGRASMVVVFEPQPQEYFRGDSAPARLTPLRDKLALLSALGVDYLLCLRFDRALAQTSAADFMQHLLVEALGVHHLVVGDDFRFGHGRKGDFQTLVQAGGRLGFSVEEADTYQVDGVRVSSTRIRDALRAADFDLAERLLGRPYRVAGRVIHGDKRGREWGFPTANIAMDRRRMPFTGIYAVEVFGVGAGPVKGVASIGVRPTVPGPTRSLLEVYLFHFDGDLYGKRIEVGFMEKIRDEERFENFDALKTQIAADIKQVGRFFDRRKRAGTA